MYILESKFVSSRNSFFSPVQLLQEKRRKLKMFVKTFCLDSGSCKCSNIISSSDSVDKQNESISNGEHILLIFAYLNNNNSCIYINPLSLFNRHTILWWYAFSTDPWKELYNKLVTLLINLKWKYNKVQFSHGSSFVVNVSLHYPFEGFPELIFLSLKLDVWFNWFFQPRLVMEQTRSGMTCSTICVQN